MSAIQFIQTTPEEFQAQIQNGIKNQLEGFFQKIKIDNPDELLTRTETAEFLKISLESLWAWTKKGKLKSYGIGNRVYYKKSELLECLIEIKR